MISVSERVDEFHCAIPNDSLSRQSRYRLIIDCRAKIHFFNVHFTLSLRYLSSSQGTDDRRSSYYIPPFPFASVETRNGGDATCSVKHRRRRTVTRHISVNVCGKVMMMMLLRTIWWLVCTSSVTLGVQRAKELGDGKGRLQIH